MTPGEPHETIRSMNLAPCRDCHRHVIVGPPCPFCGAPSPKARPVFRPRAAGRFALLFASTMGLSGCAEEATAPPALPVAPVAPAPEPMQPMDEQPMEELAQPEPIPEVEPVAPDEVRPEEPVEHARPPRPRPPPDPAPVPAYGAPVMPDPGMTAAYGGPAFDDDL